MLPVYLFIFYFVLPNLWGGGVARRTFPHGLFCLATSEEVERPKRKSVVPEETERPGILTKPNFFSIGSDLREVKRRGERTEVTETVQPLAKEGTAR